MELNERIVALQNFVSYSETLCVLTECKEATFYGSPDPEVLVDMVTAWSVLMECACEFEELHRDNEWAEADWYGTLEVFYAEHVKPKLFVL